MGNAQTGGRVEPGGAEAEVRPAQVCQLGAPCWNKYLVGRSLNYKTPKYSFVLLLQSTDTQFPPPHSTWHVYSNK